MTDDTLKKHSLNAVPPVCILTAGKGSRMGSYCAHLNKALLPLGKKAIISHIIEKFPIETEFVIALGNRGEQVRTYLTMAHPEHTFHFVEVDVHEGPGSGPGYSVLCCKHHLQRPFFYVSCDTLWKDTSKFPQEFDWFGVAATPEEHRAAYCNFEVAPDSDIVAIHDKTKISGSHIMSFVGLGFVKHVDLFWRALESQTVIQGERQVSNGIRALVEARHAKARSIEWMDTGTIEQYEKAMLQFENYDFSKPDEALFISNGRVIKYFADHAFAKTRVDRARMNPSVFPDVSDAEKGFYYYPFISGKNLYDRCTPEIFAKLLPWLEKNLWKDVSVEPPVFEQACDSFYRKKTEERLKKYFAKYPESTSLRSVNTVPLKPVHNLLASIPWNVICSGKPVFFHGDFHFDHILYDESDDIFRLLDWRQDFAGHTEFGDLYYDFAKFCGGLYLNYDYIKNGLFQYSENNDSAWVDFAHRAQGDWYRKEFESFIEQRQYNVAKVRLLIPIIYLNMSPLHHYPFDKFLFALGCLRLQTELENHGIPIKSS